MIWHEPAKVHWIEIEQMLPTDAHHTQKGCARIRRFETIRAAIEFVMTELCPDSRRTALLHSTSVQMSFKEIRAAYGQPASEVERH